MSFYLKKIQNENYKKNSALKKKKKRKKTIYLNLKMNYYIFNLLINYRVDRSNNYKLSQFNKLQ